VLCLDNVFALQQRGGRLRVQERDSNRDVDQEDDLLRVGGEEVHDKAEQVRAEVRDVTRLSWGRVALEAARGMSHWQGVADDANSACNVPLARDL
jgi:hypothetical protein